MNYILWICGSIFGLLECFLGYRIFRFCLAISGFVFGFGLGEMGYLMFNPAGMGSIWYYIWAMLGGVLIAILAFSFYKIGIFLLALSSILSFFGSVYYLVAGETEISFGIAISFLLLGIIGGFIAIKFQRAAVILFSSFCGGCLAAQSILSLFQIHAFISGGDALTFGVTMVLTILGVAVQFRTTKKIRRR